MSETSCIINDHRLIDSIFACAKSDIVIHISSTLNADLNINDLLKKMLAERKKIAESFVSLHFNPEVRESYNGNLLELFSKYNNEIIKLVGLYTL